MTDPQRTRRGIILYGPPASGKDTITTELHKLDPQYVLFPRLKVGPGRTAGYRMTTTEHADQLRANGDIIWENHRYNALYIVDRPELEHRLDQHTPVLHLGQPEAINAVRESFADVRWVVAYLKCPRHIALGRISQRDTGDTEARIQAWNDTAPIDCANFTIDTAMANPSRVAEFIQAIAK